MRPLDMIKVMGAALTVGAIVAAASVRVPIIDHLLYLNPLIGLMPFAVLCWGRSSMYAFAAGLLGGEWLAGELAWLSLFRIGGWLAAGETGWALMHHHPMNRKRNRRPPDHVQHLITASVPAVLLAAAVESLGTDMLHLYPFPYIYGILGLHHLIWTLVLIPLARQLLRQDPVRLGGSELQDARALLIWTGGLGAGAAGCLAAFGYYHMKPFQPYIIGVRTGWAVYVLTLLFILIWLYGLIDPRRRLTSKLAKR